ncbi:hypothetical protein OH492_07070 [Vibrio chagasii]|nr:hypothetical protein [Vibrio chagasii]
MVVLLFKFAVVDAETGAEHLTGLCWRLGLPEARMKWKLLTASTKHN